MDAAIPRASSSHVAFDELHRVVDRHPSVHAAARRVYIKVYLPLGILGVEMQKPRHDHVRDLLVDGSTQKTIRRLAESLDVEPRELIQEGQQRGPVEYPAQGQSYSENKPKKKMGF
jgi:hypothetical protein